MTFVGFMFAGFGGGFVLTNLFCLLVFVLVVWPFAGLLCVCFCVVGLLLLELCVRGGSA
jgi:hypothetical protein